MPQKQVQPILSRALGFLAFILILFTASVSFANLNLTPRHSDPDISLELTAGSGPSGAGIVGDNIDMDRGGLSLSAVDISLPGNSDLPVSFSRSYALDGVDYHGGILGSWNIDVPFITARVLEDRLPHNSDPNNYEDGWKNDRCTSTVRQWFSTTLSGDVLQQANDDIWAGARMFIPGQGGKLLLEDVEGSSDFWGGTKPKKTTIDHWRLDCLDSIQNGPGEGFEATSPAGVIYKFDYWGPREAGRMGVFRFGDSCNENLCENNLEEFEALAIHANIYATEVTDIHGNWVKYDYNTAGPLTKIYANDGREITFQYTDGRITKVTANGRDWEYAHSYQHPNYHLDTVTRPDGTFWEYDLEPQKPDQIGGYFLGSPPGSVTVTHPNGTEAQFDYTIIQNGKNNVSDETKHDWPGLAWNAATGTGEVVTGGFEQQSSSVTKAITKKTLTVKNPLTSSEDDLIWTYWYEQDGGYRNAPNAPSSLDLKKRIATDPNGYETHYWYDRRHLSPTEYMMMKSERYDGSELLSRSVPTYLDAPSMGDSSVRMEFAPSRTSDRVTVKTVTEQDGDTFTTESTYNTNLSSPDYSYGQPVSTRSFSNVAGSTSPRGQDIEYIHNKSAWILGLTDKTYELATTGARREMSSYNYNNKGQVTSRTRYGQVQATYGYHADGNIEWVQDSLNRRTEADNWYRGKPRRVKNAVGSANETQTEQILDDNGWVTSQTDANGNRTRYTYDVMGRVTKVNPPGSWDDTDITYDFPNSGGAIQTTTKGQSRSTTTYDSLLRPILQLSEATDTEWSSYVNTKYDGLGRVIFKSQPSTDPTETKGVETTYDGLSRVYDVTENVAPFATTEHRYLNNHRYRVTDPSGAYTQYYAYGYGGPGNKDYRAIYRRTGNVWVQRTNLHQNEWGQLVRLQQRGNHDGYSDNESQYFYYDEQQRLCRHYVPEHGASLYEYDIAGQMTAYAKGQADSGCGTVPDSEDKVTMTYDDLGRQTRTDFSDGATPRIRRTYDANGNVLRVNRGTGSSSVRWTYAYDDLNNLISEKLDIDGRSYDSYYSYNSSGYMTQRIQPNGRVINYLVDGLGRMSGVQNGAQTLASNVNYHPSGSVHQMTYGNGQYFSQILNARLLPQRLLSYKGSTKAIDQTLDYDARGLVTSILDGAVSGNDRSYSYDGLGYLKTASGPWGPNGAQASGSYTYDGLGNLREKKLGSRTVTLNYDSARNRLSQSIDTGASGTRTVAYDNRGNVTTLGNLAFVYDKSDQPVAVSGTANGIGSANGNYRYDGNLKRVKSLINGQTIYNVYDASGKLILIDKASEGERIDYVSGPTGSLARITTTVDAQTGAVGEDKVIYLHPDHLGSAQAGTKGQGYAAADRGDVAWREQYTPFGEQLQSPAANDNLDGFTGHIKDKDTGLNYMQARYYDPVIGRFLSVDPVTFMDSGNPAAFNRYSYALNNPINLIDPSGACVENITCPETSHQVLSSTRVVTTDNTNGSQTDTRVKTSRSVDGTNTSSENKGSITRLPQASANGAAATITSALQEKLLNFSEAEGENIEVTSGERTAAQNRAVGGSPGSNHLDTNGAQAADIRIAGRTPHATANAAHSSGEFNRVNEYDPSLPTYSSGSGVHVDLRATGNQGRFTNWVHEPDPDS